MNGIRFFDDYDAWGDAISGASLRMACAGIERRAWSLGFLDLGGVALQVASEGGGTICYGANSNPGTILFVPLTHPEMHVVNGQRFDADSLLVIPRDADFRIQGQRRAHDWCSIALPFDTATPTSWIARSPAALPRLKRRVHDIARTLFDRPAGTAAHHAAGRELAVAALSCLAGDAELREPQAVVGRPRLDRATIVRRAMVALDAGPPVPTAADLAAAVGITNRTLLRAFQESFGVSPKQFLMLRELHAVRRDLRTGTPQDPTVADVLARHGIWEFGRFASRYRRHFGELPSETLRRARG